MPGKIRRRPTPPEYVMRQVAGVPLTFLNDAGEQVKELFTLRFKSYTPFGFLNLTRRLSLLTFAGEEHQRCAIWADAITEIIDAAGQPLTDDEGNPAQLTDLFFLGLLDEDRAAIKKALDEDANPPKTAPESGDSGSVAAASAV